MPRNFTCRSGGWSQEPAVAYLALAQLKKPFLRLYQILF